MNEHHKPYRWAVERLREEFGPSRVLPYSRQEGDEVGVELRSPGSGSAFRLKLRDPGRDYDINASPDRDEALDDAIEEVHTFFEES